MLVFVSPLTATETKNPVPPVEPMQIYIVTSSDPACAPNCKEWIAAQGKITADNVPQFKKILKSLGARKLAVLVHSLGGDVNAAEAIGTMIRAAKLDVVVAQTVFDPYCKPENRPCPAQLKSGKITGHVEEYRAYCLSACPLMLAGGIHRYIGVSSFAGVHQITRVQTMRYVRKFYRVTNQKIGNKLVEVSRRLLREVETKRVTTTAQATKSTTDEVADYFKSMGVNADIMKPLLATPATQMHILTRAELNTTQLVTEPIGISAFSANGLITNPLANSVKTEPTPFALVPPKDSLTLSFLDVPAAGAGTLNVMITAPLVQNGDTLNLIVDLQSNDTFSPNTQFRLRLDFGHGSFWVQSATNYSSSAMKLAFAIDKPFLCRLPDSALVTLQFDAHHATNWFNMPMKVFNARQFLKLDDAQNNLCRP
eukprot:gene15176-15318_t